MKIIDARGELCPKPVIMTKKVLDEMTEGSVETIVDNDVARQNLERLANSLGCTSEVNKVSDKEYHVTINKCETCQLMFEDEDSTVIMIGSDIFGKDEELGKILMKSLLFTISETKPYPKAMLFYNAGVRLTIEGSESLDDLKNLSEQGVEIISCGTCLDFYGIKDKLQVGIIGNMYAIYESATSAKNTITIG